MIRIAAKTPRPAVSRPLPVRIKQGKTDVIVFAAIWVVSMGAPWCVGGVHDAVFALAGFIALFAVLVLAWGHWKSLEVPRCGSSTVAWIFLLPFLLGALQVMPIPDALHRKISPVSIETRDRLQAANRSDQLTLSGASSPARGDAPRKCVSLSPAATQKGLSRYWVAVAFLLLSVYSLSQSKWLPFYFSSLAFNGVAIAIFALIQKLSWNGKIFWSLEVPWASVLGPFVNKNNGAGYLLMVLAVVMMMLYRHISHSHPDAPRSFRASFLRLFNDNRLIFVFGALMFLWIAIVVSMSRGAFVGGLAATLATVIFVWRRNWVVAIALGALSASLVVGLIVWSEQTTSVQNRIASIGDKTEYRQERFAHWSDDLRMGADFLLTGSGIGTYPNANRPYQEVPKQAWYNYCENQYLESLVVGGLGGLALVLIFLGILWHAVVRLIFYGRQNPRIARYATLGLFLLIAQMISAFFDFGLYHVPNACLLACLCGIVLGKAHTILPRRRVNKSPLELRRAFQVIVLVTVSLGIWSVVQLTGNAWVEWAMNGSSYKIEVIDAGPHVSKHLLDAEIERLATSLRWHPSHAFGQARLANLHIMRFRQDFFDELESGSGGSLDEDTLWKLTRMHVVRSIVLGRESDVHADDPRPLFNDASYQRHLLPAWKSLLASRNVCPMLPRVHYRLALLSPLVDASTTDVTRHLKRSIFLAPQNVSLHFHSGRLMVEHRERQAGLEWMKKAAMAQRVMPAHIASFARNYLSPSELVNSVLPDDPGFILDVINRYFRGESDLGWRLALGNRSLKLLETVQEEERSPKTVFQLARSLQFVGQSRLACETYRSAIESEPGMAQWRFAYAETLSDAGDFDSALREARLCERMLPDSWRVKRLIYNIHKLKRDQS